MDVSTTDPQKPKKKKSSGILGCDQCRRRKTKCDQAKPTCGPCIHAGLMECTSLLGKPPPPKRKKPQTEVGILEARLESIESAYSERLRHMESLLNKVLPASQTPDPPIAPSYSRTSTGSFNIIEPKQSPRQETIGSSKLSQHMTPSQSSASPIAPAFTSPDSYPLDETDSDDSSDLGELAATMDKLRLFDASFYFGKGTMLFTQTDTEKFWDEEISFDVHEAPDIDIPPEALFMPPLEVIDTLFDIYYSQLFYKHSRIDTSLRVYFSLTVSAASVTGRRPLIDNSEIDVPLVDPNATEGEFEYSNTLYLLHLCKLWRIYRNVKQYVFNAEDVPEMAPGSLPKSYEQQLIQWQLQLPAALRFSFELDPRDPLAKYNARAGIAQMLYESTLILLHKPFMTASDQSKRSASRSLDICMKAASKITSIAKTLVKTYTKTYQITGIGECAMANAIRILAVCLKSPDPKIAKSAQDDFDFLMRFFREFYASPQVIIDKDMFNCIMSFFDEFMHSVNGVSESTVHICASAIKSMAIAKRNKIALRRTLTDDHESRRYLPADGDTRNLSRLVKIGKEERARTKSYSPSSQSSKGSKTASGGHRKRHSHMQHEDPHHRHGTSLFTPFSHEDHNGFMACVDPAVSTSLDSSELYQSPGKVQKVSQYVSPFGGPAVMESLSQYQTSSAILSQPPNSSAIPQSAHLSDPVDDIFHVFHSQQQQQHQPHQEQELLDQQQRQQQQEYQLQLQHQKDQHEQQQQQLHQQQQLFLQQQQTAQGHQGQMDRSQTMFDQSGSQAVSTFDVLAPSFWGDFMESEGMTNTDPRVLEQGGLLGGPTIPPGTFDVMSPTGANPGDLYGNIGSQLDSRHLQQGRIPALVKADSREKSTGEADNNLVSDQIQALLEQTLAGDTQPNHSNISQSGPSMAQHPHSHPHQHPHQHQEHNNHNSNRSHNRRNHFHQHHSAPSSYPHLFS
ncbi:hypothetical protein EC991_000572 [Linnemannia zychae]|nr:hypothetical protein EC991_000572 [Linnemannia zychae]